ncbi:MAG: class II glutamine amidotransferase [Bacilli bacterium]
MCRLALFNKPGIDHIENTIGLKTLFNHLELSLGGHGNGYCIVFNNRTTRIKKGIQLTNKEITADILNNYKNIKWIIYHTRLASTGVISDENCHPFKDHKNILAMNGTEYEVKKIIKDDTTDTETILRMCNIAKIDIEQGTKKFNSVFLGYNSNSKQVFANRNNGNLEYLQDNDSIIFASEFLPDQYINNNIYLAPKTWTEGEKINIKNLKPIIKKKISKQKQKYNDYDYLLEKSDYYMPAKYRLLTN